MADEHLSAAILIVDDESSNVRLLEHVLRRAGYVAFSSTLDSTTVVALHRENHYKLLILDLQMPKMNGYEVMTALKEFPEPERPAILVMSADPTQSSKSLREGARSFLGKPYTLPEVLARVCSLLAAA